MNGIREWNECGKERKSMKEKRNDIEMEDNKL